MRCGDAVYQGLAHDRAGWNEPSLGLAMSTNEVVAPIHFKAVPVILMTPEEVDLWLTGFWDEVKHRQRPLPGNMRVVAKPPAAPTEEGQLL
jgi:putative SOS response-associated peptidase YedK